eukprot:272673-Pleurochrysis_carterae.AAC.1
MPRLSIAASNAYCRPSRTPTDSPSRLATGSILPSCAPCPPPLRRGGATAASNVAYCLRCP